MALLASQFPLVSIFLVQLVSVFLVES